MSDRKKYLIVVVGPTAIGKTALSIRLAEAFGTEILSCDSRQFFKEMRIGTAVPEPEELDAAKHHFIQNKSIFENYTVGDFEKEALALLENLYQNHDVVVLVGGSGLYVDAILKGFDEFPEVLPEIREEINKAYQLYGIDYLKTQLRLYDPEYYKVVDTENPQRMARALEVCLSSKNAYSSYLGKRENPRNFTPILIGLEAPRELIYERINLRVDQMIDQGLVEEARKLYPNRELNALQTVGYRELFDYFDANVSLDFAISEIKKNTRRFAKRQLTWFRRNPEIAWFAPNAVSEIISYVHSKIKF